MGANTAENTNLRLKAVLDVLAEEVWTGEKLNAGAVLGEAIARVPLNDHERELLSGGIPRGHKTLTTATAKLVKAGWLVKGRSGWTIPEDGLRATVAFPDVSAFAEALDAGMLAVYEKTIARRGVGAARLFHGKSEGSGMMLSPGDLAEVKAAADDDIVFCPDSGCILVRSAEWN